MAYEKVSDLSTDTVYKIGGVDSKTNKPNPTQMEGFYLGCRTVPNNDGGTSNIHVFQTPKGNIGVWGTADLNSKLSSVNLGTQTLIEYKGKKKLTGGKTKHMYDVSVDKDNTIEVANLSAGNTTVSAEYAEEGNYVEVDDDTLQAEALAAVEAAAARKAAVMAKLNGNKTAKG